ncbi:uncharacterized protein LOC121472168 isoform X3 [Vulpes lagopus]|uniref:uncharacterized protein LOC121472168 isoform X3 n=1 Tax=Vulpes lagopus TaxID=494514 RepID=UPI001BC9D382|nr:uncharacterized protein LOC121472168 isoform X3 [Vulpes lagopus]
MAGGNAEIVEMWELVKMQNGSERNFTNLLRFNPNRNDRITNRPLNECVSIRDITMSNRFHGASRCISTTDKQPLHFQCLALGQI